MGPDTTGVAEERARPREVDPVRPMLEAGPGFSVRAKPRQAFLDLPSRCVVDCSRGCFATATVERTVEAVRLAQQTSELATVAEVDAADDSLRAVCRFERISPVDYTLNERRAVWSPLIALQKRARMAEESFISYIRVSTQKQGASGLGLEAQSAAVQAYLTSVNNSKLIAEYVEVESGKGSNALELRPQLRAALQHCRKTRSTLLIAKLDRLARDVHFISGLIKEGVDFVCADMPQASKVMLQMYSVMAEWERDQISARTKAALAAAKARGVVLGNPRNLEANRAKRAASANAFAARLEGALLGMKLRGLTQRAMVSELNHIGISAPRGGTWVLIQLQRLLKRQSIGESPSASVTTTSVLAMGSDS